MTTTKSAVLLGYNLKIVIQSAVFSGWGKLIFGGQGIEIWWCRRKENPSKENPETQTYFNG